MYLFEMTESQLESAVQAHYNNLYDRYYGTNEPDRECSNCRFYCDGLCERLVNELSAGEWDDMEDSNDYSSVEKDPDDCCDEHEFKEE